MEYWGVARILDWSNTPKRENIPFAFVDKCTCYTKYQHSLKNQYCHKFDQLSSFLHYCLFESIRMQAQSGRGNTFFCPAAVVLILRSGVER